MFNSHMYVCVTNDEKYLQGVQAVHVKYAIYKIFKYIFPSIE